MLRLNLPQVSPVSSLTPDCRWHGVDDLRTQANNIVRNKDKDGVWVPNTWKSELQALYRHDCFAISFGFLIKYFSYALLLVVTCSNIKVCRRRVLKLFTYNMLFD